MEPLFRQLIKSNCPRSHTEWCARGSNKIVESRAKMLSILDFESGFRNFLVGAQVASGRGNRVGWCSKYCSFLFKTQERRSSPHYFENGAYNFCRLARITRSRFPIIFFNLSICKPLQVSNRLADDNLIVGDPNAGFTYCETISNCINKSLDPI